jgi:hypothetical protein
VSPVSAWYRCPTASTNSHWRNRRRNRSTRQPEQRCKIHARRFAWRLRLQIEERVPIQVCSPKNWEPGRHGPRNVAKKRRRAQVSLLHSHRVFRSIALAHVELCRCLGTYDALGCLPVIWRTVKGCDPGFVRCLPHNSYIGERVGSPVRLGDIFFTCAMRVPSKIQ